MLRDPIRFLTETYRARGPVFRLEVAGRRFVVIAGAEANLFMVRHEREHLSYAIYRGVARARPVALLYAGTMTVSVLEFFGWEWGSGAPPTNLAAFFGVNGPYLVVPILLAVRMWRPRPFGREEG
jgi:hypothetical protein